MRYPSIAAVDHQFRAKFWVLQVRKSPVYECAPRRLQICERNKNISRSRRTDDSGFLVRYIQLKQMPSLMIWLSRACLVPTPQWCDFLFGFAQIFHPIKHGMSSSPFFLILKLDIEMNVARMRHDYEWFIQECFKTPGNRLFV